MTSVADTVVKLCRNEYRARLPAARLSAFGVTRSEAVMNLKDGASATLASKNQALSFAFAVADVRAVRLDVATENPRPFRMHQGTPGPDTVPPPRRRTLFGSS